MSNVKAQVKQEIKNMIIENHGNLLNKHILEIYRKYKPVVGLDIVTITQDACNIHLDILVATEAKEMCNK